MSLSIFRDIVYTAHDTGVLLLPRAAKVTKNARRVGLSAFRHQSESHSLSVMSFLGARIKPSENRHHRRNLCGSPVLLPLWTPERCRQNYRLAGLPLDAQRRSGKMRKIVAPVFPDTEFWSGPRQNRHRSKHDCNRVGLQKLLFSLIPWSRLPHGELNRDGFPELYAVGGQNLDAPNVTESFRRKL